ncbi:MAG: SDR family NAD(P)-dependent oxidoreductase [Hyphomicrobiaceae bacterium]|nr:SDR family NAD(P)-dependent oxidoreductase [Hyphomicrobiaceae bacterium]
MSKTKRLQGRLAFVSGASRGLGRATALALAREGAHIIVTARTSGALEELDDEIRAAGGAATLLALDLRKSDRLDQLGPTIFQRWDKLDVLVANAGILGPLSPLPHVTADAWTSVIETNLSANWRLIRTFDPLLQRAKAARVVFVSSSAATAKNAYWGPYAVSKAGLEALAKTYAHENANTPVNVNIVDPGPMATAMRAKAFPGEDPKTIPTPADVAQLVLELCLPSEKRNGDIVRYREWSKAKDAAAATAEAES